MGELIIQILSYWGFFIAGIILLMFLTRGFLLQWILVLTSRGKKLLVQVQDPIQDYFVTGKIISGKLHFKDRESKKDSSSSEKRIEFDKSFIFRAYGVNCVLFNDVKNCLLTTDLKGSQGFDPLDMNNLLLRALSRPETESDDRKRTITMIASIGAVIIGILIFYKLTGIEKSIQFLTSTPTKGVIPLGFAFIKNRK